MKKLLEFLKKLFGFKSEKDNMHNIKAQIQPYSKMLVAAYTMGYTLAPKMQDIKIVGHQYSGQNPIYYTDTPPEYILIKDNNGIETKIPFNLLKEWASELVENPGEYTPDNPLRVSLN